MTTYGQITWQWPKILTICKIWVSSNQTHLHVLTKTIFPLQSSIIKFSHLAQIRFLHKRAFQRLHHLPMTILTANTHTHTHPFNGPLSGTTRISQYQKGKTNLDFTETRDSEWQWHQLGHMQVCTLLQTDNHHSVFLQARCPSCRPTNSVKALKAQYINS